MSRRRVDAGARQVELAVADQPVDRAGRAAGQRDQAAGVVGQRGQRTCGSPIASVSSQARVTSRISAS